jgi:hypothetical protein
LITNPKLKGDQVGFTEKIQKEIDDQDVEPSLPGYDPWTYMTTV